MACFVRVDNGSAAACLLGKSAVDSDGGDDVVPLLFSTFLISYSTHLFFYTAAGLHFARPHASRLVPCVDRRVQGGGDKCISSGCLRACEEVSLPAIEC